MEKKKINNTTISILVIILLTIIVIVLGRLAYAKYIKSANGTIIASVANVICTMDVESSSEDAQGNALTPDQTTINPYCIITIKDYEGSTPQTATKITDASINYIVTVSPTNTNVTLPSYYWQNMQTQEIINTPTLQGTFTKGVAANQQFKIVFLNTNTTSAAIQEQVTFNLTAVQASSNN